MARVRTFRAWRYARPDIDISPVTAPPYDVITSEQRVGLAAKDPHNVVELELPVGTLDPARPDNRYLRARSNWDAWRASGVLVQDAVPSLYVLEQCFEVGGRRLRRRAFIVEVGLERFEEGIVLPHERTLPKALGDRFELTTATAANFSQVFGLYDDSQGVAESLFDSVSAEQPVATATDADGVVSTLWASPDPDLAAELTHVMADKRIYIADGHHRYATALAYRDLRRELAAETSDRTEDPAHDYVLMALVNMDDPDLMVLPYHRIVDAPGRLDSVAFRTALQQHFEVSDLPDGHPSGILEAQERPAFLAKLRGEERPFLAVLRADVDPVSALEVDKSDEWKRLDVSILQELVLWPLLRVHPDHPETLDRIRFVKDAHDAFNATSAHDVAFALRPTRLSQLRAVSLAGETMPQKSTYFYPKLLSGLVFRSAE